jgi:hypothetical protein
MFFGRFLFGTQALHRIYLGRVACGWQNGEPCYGKNQQNWDEIACDAHDTDSLWT